MSTPIPWHVTLFDSVYALGAAARELRTAHQQAKALLFGVQLERLRPVDGHVSVTVTGGDAFGSTSPRPHRPHDKAVFDLGDAYRKLEDQLEHAYLRAALGYAHGTAWAAHQVLAGHQPPVVEMTIGPGWDYVTGLLPELALDRYVGAREVAAARERVLCCENAADYGADLGERGYLADHEASEMHDAWDIAAGLPEAAYDYGVAAEKALHFAVNTRAAL
ncbi:hypothetical protein [Streptomyces sp. WMMC897]|uniref:hypothetical protein n=1 Tax=Streptomyces sp. WMMC897 TaxID=3014782 RepID=UPI0022B6EA5C|nr:hypothetical protein [Streptomyces sp. WMMC897]MCZ7414281.1 hypothetical protein [Streptomyces sp. WMMC897]